MKDSFSQDDVLGLDGIFGEKPKSQFRLGSLYYNGDGVERNLEKAEYWLEKSAEQGNSDAQFFLGEIYYYGGAVEHERTKYWFEKSVKQSNTIQTLLYLATLYYDGGDYKKAKYWWEKAAKTGNAEAQNNLCFFSLENVIYIKRSFDVKASFNIIQFCKSF